MLPRVLPSVFSFVFIFSFLLFVASLILHFVNYDTELIDSDEIYTSEPYDVFIFSTYYYNKSKSLGDSSIAILMTADYEVLSKIKSFELLALNETDRIIEKATLERVTPHDACKWITIMLTTPLLPNLSQIFVSLGGKHAPIPFEVISTVPKPVVMCISPLFASESWQNLLLALHVYKRFGAHMHLYVRSMVPPMLEILRVYEKEKYVSLKSWNRINLLNREDDDFNPNLNVEFRSQAAAQTDCLLKFKESSEFVAFVDLDDLLLPRVAENYLAEFNYFAAEQPNVAYFHYSKENTGTEAYRRANVFSVEHMIRNIKFEKKTETGKMVAIPSKLNSTWIHWPNKEVLKYTIPTEMNSITHLKHIEMIEGLAKKQADTVPIYDPSISASINEQQKTKPLISEKDIKWLEKDYNRMSWKSVIRRHLRNLPSSLTYSGIIGKCFKTTYYRFHEQMIESTMLCPGPERCDMSSHQAKCWNSVGEYHSTRDGKKINIHFVENSDFKLGNGCII